MEKRKRKKMILIPNSHHKIEKNSLKDHTPEIGNTLEKITGENLQVFGLDEDFLDTKQKHDP